MKLGNIYINYLPKLEIKYHSIEFNPDVIQKNTKELNELLIKNWNIESEFQTESGIVLQLSRVIKQK